MPKSDWSDADDAAFLSAAYGLTPDPWQFLVLTAWLGRRSDGKWSAGRAGLAVPRQNGKNAILEMRELFGMVVLGEKFLHTAHEVKTARKAFARLKFFFGEQAADPGAAFPELNALVKEVRSTNGQEAIVLSNGASVEFVARSRGSGRGYTVDVLALDEAQELTDEQLEALLPTISSAPTGNPQTIMTGTPPGAMAQGVVFTRTREAGVEGKSRRMAWHEWSVDGRVDVYDREQWAATNPALGGRLQLSVIEDELPPGMSLDGFARERLGRWRGPGDDAGPFPPGTWDAGTWHSEKDGDKPQIVGKVAACVDVSLDRTMAYVAFAGVNDRGRMQVEVVASRAGTDWVYPWLAERRDLFDAVTGQTRGAPVSGLMQELEAAGLPVVEWAGPDLPNGTGAFYDAVRMNEVDHLPQPVLDVAAATAVTKPSGDGWLWDRRKSPTDIAPLVAASGACWLLSRPVEAPFVSAYESGAGVSTI